MSDRPSASSSPKSADPQSFDFFISYAGADEGWARWTQQVLERAGFTTRCQFLHFLPGDSFVSGMQEALVGCRTVLCLLSPRYLTSRWCNAEWQAALLDRKCLPVRIDECRPEGLLGPLVYIDLVATTDESEAARALLRGIEKHAGRGPANTEPVRFPGGGPAPRHPRQLPSLWSLPTGRNPHFTGRDELLAELHAGLEQTGQAAFTQSVAGLGGLGKTQLALEYAYRYASEYDGVCWLRSDNPTLLAADYAALVGPLQLETPASQAAAVAAVRAALATRGRVLLIFDNAADPAALLPYLPQDPRSRALVTTRSARWPAARTHEIDVLSSDESIDLLLRCTGESDRDAAKEVAALVDGLPLALAQAAGYVESRGTTLGAYARLLRDHGLEVLDRVGVHDYPHTIATTWTLAMSAIESCRGAADLLTLCAFLAPEEIPLGDLRAASDKAPEPLDSVLDNQLELDDAIRALRRHSLLSVDGDRLSIHRLVQATIRNRLSRTERRRWLGAGLRMMEHVFPFDCDDIEHWPTCARLLPHAMAVTELVEMPKDDRPPGAVLMLDESGTAFTYLLNQMGLYLKSRGAFREAEPFYRRALKVDLAAREPDHPNIATRYGNLAMLLAATDREEEAVDLARRALAIDREHYGSQSLATGIRLQNLSLLLRDESPPLEAIRLAKTALEIFEAHYGPHDRRLTPILCNLASLARMTNRLSDARALLERALRIDEAAHVLPHPQIAIDLGGLAVTLKASGSLDQAEEHFRRAAQTMKEAVGDKHPDTASTLVNLATFLEGRGRSAEAEPLLREALPVLESALGPRHSTVTSVRRTLAKILHARNALPEAEAILVQVLEICRSTSDPSLPLALNNLGVIVRDQDRPAEAAELFAEALGLLVGVAASDDAVALVRQNLQAVRAALEAGR